MTMKISLCMSCERFDRATEDRNVCSAFPGGIPVAIFLGDVDHSKPFPGDHGLQYVAREDEDE